MHVTLACGDLQLEAHKFSYSVILWKDFNMNNRVKEEDIRVETMIGVIDEVLEEVIREVILEEQTGILWGFLLTAKLKNIFMLMSP